MSAEDAFIQALAEAREGGSDFRLALESVGGSTRALADELSERAGHPVSQRTVQRWAAYESGSGAQARNPANSPHAGELRALADVERDQRALDKLADADAFNADVEVEYVASGNAQDEGDRRAYSRAPFNMRPAVDAYRSGQPMSEVGALLKDAIAESYVLPADLSVTDVTSFSVR